MDERLTALINQIVRDANLRSIRERDELRRELESHFAEVEQTPSALDDAIERFGNPSAVSVRIAAIDSHSSSVMHLLRLGTALAGSAGVALLLQVAANLRVSTRPPTIAVAPTFLLSAAFSAFIIVALVAAWELDIESLCARLERRPLRLTVLLAGLATSMVLTHAAHDAVLPFSKALAASAVDLAIWACTIAILARTDRAFATVFSKGDA